MKKVEKPWGHYLNIYKDKKINIKIIKVKPGCRLSLQFHKKREEKWILIEGTGLCQIGGKKAVKMNPEKIYRIPREKKHRLMGGERGCRIVEISFGTFQENDVVRIEDDYGRASPRPKNLDAG